MKELFVAEVHRSLGSFVRRHGTGGLALVQYQRAGCCLVHVEETNFLRSPYLVPVDGPVIEDAIEWMVSIDDAKLEAGKEGSG